MVYKQNEWTEEALLALSTEDDRFDKKSGTIIPDSFRAIIAKAASAFANSNGGYIVLGMYDDKEKAKNGGKDFDGVGYKPKRVSFEEWLEDQIPNLLTPPLQNYRVLPVIPKSVDSQISHDKPVFVIEIEASEIAPHQVNENKVYYYREGNDSKPASHYYLEGLRSVRRFISPELIRAWLDTFLFNLDKELKALSEFYQTKDFQPSIFDSTLGQGFNVKIEHKSNMIDYWLSQPNAKQFLRRFPRFDTNFAALNVWQEKINAQAEHLKNQIAQYALLEEFIFTKFIFEPRFVDLLNAIGLRLDPDTPEQRLQRSFEIFGFSAQSDKALIMDMLGAVVTYELLSSKPISGKLIDVSPNSRSMMFIQVWNKISNEVHKIIENNPIVVQCKNECESTLDNMLHFVIELSEDLDNEIELLTARAGVPIQVHREPMIVSDGLAR